MDADRGYYFIAGESHYPNDELPSDFKLDTDEPNTVKDRKVPTDLASFRRLNELANTYNFRVLLVPTYYRPGQFAAALGLNSAAVDRLRPFDRFTVLGPDYYILDRKYFSDLLHLNRTGARLYTKKLADLVSNELHKN